jgi:DnaJ-class molecular chaperone
MADTTDAVAQTHCPGCGVHKSMCVNLVSLGDKWMCSGCVAQDARREQIRVRDDLWKLNRNLVVVNCPGCHGSGKNSVGSPCGTCGGLGSVRVPEAQIPVLNSLDVPEPKLLTEG